MRQQRRRRRRQKRRRGGKGHRDQVRLCCQLRHCHSARSRLHGLLVLFASVIVAILIPGKRIILKRVATPTAAATADSANPAGGALDASLDNHGSTTTAAAAASLGSDSPAAAVAAPRPSGHRPSGSAATSARSPSHLGAADADSDGGNGERGGRRCPQRGEDCGEPHRLDQEEGGAGGEDAVLHGAAVNGMV